MLLMVRWFKLIKSLECISLIIFYLILALSLEDYHDRFIANDRTIATAKKPKKEKNFYIDTTVEEPHADDTYEELLEDDDDDFGSVFEDDGEELDYNDPLNVIGSPEDIEDLDVEDQSFASFM